MTGQHFTAEERDFKDFPADGRENGLGVGKPGKRGVVEGLLRGLRDRRPGKVRYLVSYDHKGLRETVPQELPEAAWKRCYAHCIRNAPERLPNMAPSFLSVDRRIGRR